MIYIERTITINESSAYIEDPIVLYKGDRNIEVQFIIKNSPFKHKAGIDLTYGQLVIKRPTTNPIFSEVAKVSSSKVLFVITGDMIDELSETGNYDFQIRLLNSDLSSRATLPPVTAGFIVKEPICEESVNTAPVNYSRAVIDREVEGTFDEEGNYNKTDWSNGDIITDSKLNKIEDALYTVNDSKATKEDIPTDVSAFTNDAGYLTEHQSLEDYALKADIPSTDGLATEVYVNDAIDNIDIPEPDLSNYATKEELPPIRVIGSDNPDEPYILTGNEFTDEDYENCNYYTILFKHAVIRYTQVDDFGNTVTTGEKTFGYSGDELVVMSGWINDGVRQFDYQTVYGNYECFEVRDDGTIIRPNDSQDWYVYYSSLEDYATKDELNAALGNVEDLLGKI